MPHSGRLAAPLAVPSRPCLHGSPQGIWRAACSFGRLRSRRRCTARCGISGLPFRGQTAFRPKGLRLIWAPPVPVDPDSDENANPSSDVAAWLDDVQLAGPRQLLHEICLSLGSCANRQVVDVASGSNAGSSWMYVLRGRRPAADAPWGNAAFEPDRRRSDELVHRATSFARTHCRESAGIRHPLTVSITPPVSLRRSGVL
jgi:hypothetical protein